MHIVVCIILNRITDELLLYQTVEIHRNTRTLI